MRDVQVTYFKIHTWLPGVDKRNVLFIAEPEDDFFCLFPQASQPSMNILSGE